MSRGFHYTATPADMARARKCGQAARRVGGYTHLVRLSNEKTSLRRRGVEGKLVSIDGLWRYLEPYGPPAPLAKIERLGFNVLTALLGLSKCRSTST